MARFTAPVMAATWRLIADRAYDAGRPATCLSVR